MKKYEFVKGDVIQTESGTTLKRIQALVHIPEAGVKPGDLGGYIRNQGNLSHNGRAWVGSNARVYGNAYVYENARVHGKARVYGSAKVCGNGLVSSNRHVVAVSATGPEPISICVYPSKSTLLATVNGYTDTVTQWKHKGPDPVVTALIVAAEKLLEEMNEWMKGAAR